MSVPPACEKCGHQPGSTGHPGVCEKCGHVAAGAEAPLRLRPIEADEPGGRHGHLLDPHGPLTIRPATEDPHAKPKVISGPDDVLAPGDDYAMGDLGVKRHHGPAGPPPYWVNAPSLMARALARRLRTARDWVYLVSVAALVLALIGFLFKLKAALHVGVVVAIAANIGILAIGVAYLLTLPFKEGLRYGLANLLIPFYAVYYWSTRWHRMKTPVWNTFGSFLPIFLATLAFFAYEDGAKVVEFGERELPALEKEIEDGVNRLDRGPIKDIGRKVEKAVDSGKDQPQGPP